MNNYFKPGDLITPRKEGFYELNDFYSTRNQAEIALVVSTIPVVSDERDVMVILTLSGILCKNRWNDPDYWTLIASF